MAEDAKPTPLEHIPIAGEITIDLNKAFSMQTFYETISSSFPKDKSVVGIAIPLINAECKGLGVIDPVNDIKRALSDLYDYAMKSILEPIWNVLHELIDFLKSVFDFKIDYTLPVLDIQLTDLFKKDLKLIIKEKLKEWYYYAKDKLNDLLDLLGIPRPIYNNLQSAEKELENILQSVMRSLWSFMLKTITKIIGLIKTAVDIWDRVVNQGRTFFGTLWQQVVDAVIGKFLDLMINMPTMKELEEMVKEFARKVWNKAVVTYEEIMQVIYDFEIPIIKIKPFDWKPPLNLHLNCGDIDFKNMLVDIKTWLTNYLVNILKEFILAVIKVIRALFSIKLELPVISIPLTLCVVA
jgi:hypothetical protein